MGSPEPLRIDIGGRFLCAKLSGAGPLIVLESGGGRAGVDAAQGAEQRLTAFARVLTYDRAGLGGSDAPDDAPTAARRVDDLRALLDALGLIEPAVLIGQSLSGLIVQLFACEHPRRTRALLLVDPTPAYLYRGLPSTVAAPDFVVGEDGKRAPMSEALRLEIGAIRESAEQVRRAVDGGQMPDVPVVVVTAGVRGGQRLAEPGRSLLYRCHRAIAERAPQGRLVIAEKSGHASVWTYEPELLIKALHEIIHSTRDTI